MALLNINKNYIRLIQLNNTQVKCIIYKNKSERDLQKAATRSDVIIEKFEQLISEYRLTANLKIKEEGLAAYVGKNNKKISATRQNRLIEILEPLAQLQDEYSRYRYCLNSQIKGDEKFPLISKYIENPEDSLLPNTASIILSVTSCDNLDKVYEEIKRLKIFGETEDC